MRITLVLICALSLFPHGGFAQESKPTSIDQKAFLGEWRKVQDSYPNVSAAMVQWQGISTQGRTVCAGNLSPARIRICSLCRAPSFTVIKKEAAIERSILINGAVIFMKANECLRRTMECAGPSIPWDCEPNGDEFKECFGDVEFGTKECPDWCN